MIDTGVVATEQVLPVFVADSTTASPCLAEKLKLVALLGLVAFVAVLPLMLTAAAEVLVTAIVYAFTVQLTSTTMLLVPTVPVAGLGDNVQVCPVGCAPIDTV